MTRIENKVEQSKNGFERYSTFFWPLFFFHHLSISSKSLFCSSFFDPKMRFLFLFLLSILSSSLYHYFLFTLPFSSFFFANFWYFLFPYHIHSIVFLWRISFAYNFWYMFDTSVRILKITFHSTLHQISKNCPIVLLSSSLSSPSLFLSPSSFGPWSMLYQMICKWTYEYIDTNRVMEFKRHKKCNMILLIQQNTSLKLFCKNRQKWWIFHLTFSLLSSLSLIFFWFFSSKLIYLVWSPIM